MTEYSKTTKHEWMEEGTDKSRTGLKFTEGEDYVSICTAYGNLGIKPKKIPVLFDLLAQYLTEFPVDTDEKEDEE